MKHATKTIRSLALVVLTYLLPCCNKSAGPGGHASVKGRVIAYDFDNTYHYLLSKEYAPGVPVYICYGNTNSANANVRTTPDGSFAFLYLTKGHYKVFVNSADTSIKINGNNTNLAVIKEFDITGKTQTVDLGDLTLCK